jgi:hypothetical protein
METTIGKDRSYDLQTNQNEKPQTPNPMSDHTQAERQFAVNKTLF